MERDQVPAPQRFVDDLRQLRLLAGQPSYSTLERLSVHRLKRATMSDVLNGNRVKLPDWRFVHEFVTACRAAATENRLDANELGTVADWKRRWDGAADGVIDARFPGHDSRPLSRAERTMAAQRAAPVPVVADGPATRDPGDAVARPQVARPQVWGPVPSRLPDFAGRQEWLETLRQTLTRDDRTSVVAIQGLCGVGKTQLALEYAYRYSREYDLVWWVPCDDTESAHAAMADLAAVLELAEVAPAVGESDHDYTELLDTLRRGERYEHWLLIFDNAGEPDEIRKLIPPENATGHVLVTTRNSRWEASGHMVELDVFGRAESIEFLSSRIPRFSAAAAHRLAEGVGDLPLLLEHAAESHVMAGTYLARLDSDPLGLLDGQPADYHATIASEWRTALGKLRADAPDAIDLLRCLAFFGSDPVPREALERASYLAEISIHAMLRDPFRRHAAIRRLRRAGLLRVHADTQSLSVHQVTRCIVRDMVVRSGAADEERARHDVHLLLTAADPLAPEDPATWRSYDELRGHAVESGAAACSQDAVRKFVVNLVRFLNAAGDPHAALDMADCALAQWGAHPAAGGEGVPDSHVAMHLARAGALFARGQHAEAFNVRQQALAALRPDPGRWAAEIIGLEGTAGAWCRVTGDFAAALAADTDSVRAHVEEFGDDDPRTFDAMNSLIADLGLGGSNARAADVADSVYRNCLAFYGDDSHPAVLAARNVLGRCRWLCGEYGEAVGVMAEVRSGYDDLAESGMLDENHPWRLTHEIDYAIARRDKGLVLADLQALADDMQKVRRRCWRTLGPDHPQTLAATVILGSILRRIDGRAGEAVRLLEEAGRRYPTALPGHPYGYACGAYLAAVRYRAASDGPGQTAAQSVLVLHDLIGRLADAVGDNHPLSLMAVSILANTLARAGEPEAALKRGQEALLGFRDLLGPHHPHTRTVEANTQAVQSGLSLEPGSFPGDRLEDIDFTPLPL